MPEFDDDDGDGNGCAGSREITTETFLITFNFKLGGGT
jgi:hypothetical protein